MDSDGKERNHILNLVNKCNECRGESKAKCPQDLYELWHTESVTQDTHNPLFILWLNNTRTSVENELCTCLLIRHGPNRKRRVQQFFYSFVCIRCHGNVFTEPLSSNDRGICIQSQRLMGGIYVVRRWDGLRCHDIHTKFHQDWSRHWKVNRGGFTDTNTARWSHKATFFFQNKESRILTVILKNTEFESSFQTFILHVISIWWWCWW
jgi:hypothetical protein